MRAKILKVVHHQPKSLQTSVLPPAPAVGAKPRLVDKLEKAGTEEVSIEKWSLLEKAASDEDAHRRT